MQIERNLLIPLRSQIERITDHSDQVVTPNHTLVDRDRGRKKDQQQNPDQESETPAEHSAMDVSEESASAATAVTTPVVIRRLDVVV